MTVTDDSRPHSSSADGLDYVHNRLHAHFRDLRKRRDAEAPGAPIFALEHGLSQNELALVRTDVQIAIHRRNLPSKSWLPMVVYATEVGYEYSGEEYWQTFNHATPNWLDTDRPYLKQRFQQFKTEFGGSEPSGAWARNFSIISWPITHAVLPTDLQRHLARLLSEYRTAWTEDLLRDPTELGKRLAAQSWQSSARFQTFAQNTALLGRVSVALLTHQDNESPYLLSSTLKRIITDLERENQARIWLRDARSAATQVRFHGFSGDKNKQAGATSSSKRLALQPDVKLSVRQETGGWCVYLELADLSVLAERLPSAHDELGRLRSRVAGVGSLVASGRLLFKGQQLRLAEWPEPGTPLLQLEGGSQEANRLLAQQCTLSPGPIWLFRMRESGIGLEVRGGCIRPRHPYVFLSRSPMPGELPAWITSVKSATRGVQAYVLDAPSILEASQMKALHSIGLGVVTDVDIHPAGFVPALWDGEGRGEWMVGEQPLIALSSSQEVATCIVRLDEAASLITWPVGKERIFFGLTGLDVGKHNFHVSLFSGVSSESFAEGSLEVTIRPPHARSLAGSLREGLMILPSPVSPTLAELWDGNASLQVFGPPNLQVDITVSLEDRRRVVLASQHLTAVLPLGQSAWISALTTQVRTKALQRCVDTAETCVVAVAHPDLGEVEIRCDREFSPLRWAVGTDRDGPFARLIDNTDGEGAKVTFLRFTQPDISVSIDLDNRLRMRNPDGGLISAAEGGFQTSAILPPRIKDGGDFSRMRSRPQLKEVLSSDSDVLGLIAVAQAWAGTALPADPFAKARRLDVLRSFASHVGEQLGGTRWARIERRVPEILSGEDRISVSELAWAVGDPQYIQDLASEIRTGIAKLQSIAPMRRADFLGKRLASHARYLKVPCPYELLAEFLLRLASAPNSLASWSGDRLAALAKATIANPFLIRVARFMVIMVHLSGHEGGSSAYEGWTWE